MKTTWFAASLACLTLASAAGAEETPGEVLYFNHCAACHGIELTGAGVMAGVMVIKPADLTILSRENDGTFPLLRVVQRIDGRDPLVSHGSPMPVYGDFFEGSDIFLKTESGQPLATSAPVAELVEFIKSKQAE